MQTPLDPVEAEEYLICGRTQQADWRRSSVGVRQPAEWLVEDIEGWDERRAYLGSDTLFSHRRLGRLYFLPRHRSSNVEPHVRILAETCPGQAGYHSCDRLLRRCSVLRSDRENYGQQAPRLRHILTTVHHATPASTAAGLMRNARPVDTLGHDRHAAAGASGC